MLAVISCNLIVDSCFKINRRTLRKKMTLDTESRFAKYSNTKYINKLIPPAKTLFRKLQIETIPDGEMSKMRLYQLNKNTYGDFTFDKYLGLR